MDVDLVAIMRVIGGKSSSRLFKTRACYMQRFAL